MKMKNWEAWHRDEHPASPVCSERCGSANFQTSTVRTHYPSAHQPSLAARPKRCKNGTMWKRWI